MTYEYECTACTEGWEEEQRITDAPSTQCPCCGNHTAKRLVSGGSGFKLKGGGWAAQGYSKS